MASADLTAARLREVLHYDPETGLFTWLVDTHRRRKGFPAGSKRPDGYFHIGIDGGRYLAHRLAFLYMTDQWPEFQADHENVRPSDTRWCNLRPATASQNQQNKRVYKNNRCGFRGVFKKRNRWGAKLMINRKTINLGYFKTPEEAAAARLNGERKYFTHSPACKPQM